MMLAVPQNMAAPAAERRAPLLEVSGLGVTFRTDTGPLKALDDVSFSLAPGETMAIVGESGSGKSVLSLALMGLLSRRTATVTADAITFAGRDVLGIADRDLRRLRGREMSMIFQEPATALNPVRTVGAQIAEAIRLHEHVSRAEAQARAIDMLRMTGIPAPETRARAYPHELSGGMRQRAMIAMSLVLKPRLLIADEPTTALDVTVQAQILDLLRGLARESGTAILMITHDLGVVAEMADRVLVLYAGRTVETAPVRQIFESPEHPYTVGLLGSMPSLGTRGESLTPIDGAVPDLRATPTGCSFHPRCPFAADRCRGERPALRDVGHDQRSACFFSPLIETLGGAA